LVVSIKIRWATVEGYGYFASIFSTSVGNYLDALEQVNFVSGNFNAESRFILYRVVRYIKLSVLGVMFSNPGGRVGLEDIIIHAASENLANLPTTKSVASSEWAHCPTCNVSLDGAFRVHGPQQAGDGDLVSWYGLPLGMTQLSTDTVLWTVTFDIPMVINIVVVRWQYPARTFSVWCAFNVSSRFSPAGYSIDNEDYLVPVVFTAPRTCRVIQLMIGQPLELFAGEGIIGIQEVEVYSTANNLALNAAVISTDGQDASESSDASDQSKWQSLSEAPVNLTYDLGRQVSGWAIRSLWSSGLAGRGFELWISDDGSTWKTQFVYENNFHRDLYSIGFFQTRFIKMILLTTQIGAWTWSLRTLAVYGSEKLETSPGSGVWKETPDHLGNLVRDSPIVATKAWNHTGLEACDGINTTFWVAEPLSTAATVRVDLQEDNFVGDGVRILWKFPAQDFKVMYSMNATVWDLLAEFKGNLENYTEVQTNFVARYVEVRMTRPSLLNGDGSYSILSFDVVFDPNLAHGKFSSATHTINPENFRAKNVIDQQPFSVWMPEQNTDRSDVIIDLLQDLVVSRFQITWRHPPKVFELLAQNVFTLEYWVVRRWVAAWGETRTPFELFYEDGFVARRLKIAIYEVSDGGEGKVCSMRDVVLETYEHINRAIGAPVEFSDEIKGNPARYATDGNARGTYWLPGEGIRSAWLLAYVSGCGKGEKLTVARTSIWWRFSPGSYLLEFYSDPVEGWYEVWRAINQQDLFTDFFKYRIMCKLRLHIYDQSPNPDDPSWDGVVALTHNIGLFDIAVYKAKRFVPPAVGEQVSFWSAPPANVNDLDIGTYWMAPPWEDLVNVYVDLGKIYNVFDVFVWFVLLSQGFRVWVSTKGFEIAEVEKRMTSTSVWGRMRLEVRGVAFRARYIRIDLFKSYQDVEFQLGTSIRDIAVYQFRNLAQSAPTSADNVWSYPAFWATDNADPDADPLLEPPTYWMSRFDSKDATLVIDLGAEYNVGGITGQFQHICSYYRFDYALENDKMLFEYTYEQFQQEPRGPATNGLVQKLEEERLTQNFNKQDWEKRVEVRDKSGSAMSAVQRLAIVEESFPVTVILMAPWTRAFLEGANKGTEIYVSPRKYHFLGRYVRLHMAQSRGLIDHPDQPGNTKTMGYVFGLVDIQIWEHTGGGGAVGIQNLDGSQFNSIVWGQRQPGEWVLGSESDIFTHDMDGGAYKEDEGNEAHIAVTFKKVFAQDPKKRRTEISFYRNGLPYGVAYQKEVDPGRLSEPNQTRLVVGVRSTIFANASADLNKIAGVHSLSHSPYFWGKIYNVTLLQNALSPEEVAGLYQVVRGGEELGCHCYDACPYGFNRFNRNVPVPCSGQGACLRNKDGIPLGPGRCECLPGYSGDNCEKHCSELSVWGCCEIDDDCPKDNYCDRKTKACSTDISVSSNVPFNYY